MCIVRHDEFLEELWHLWRKFKRWESLQGICTSTALFTKASLHMSSATNYPLLKIKAANCRIVISWLAGAGDWKIPCSTTMHGNQLEPHTSNVASKVQAKTIAVRVILISMSKQICDSSNCVHVVSMVFLFVEGWLWKIHCNIHRLTMTWKRHVFGRVMTSTFAWSAICGTSKENGYSGPWILCKYIWKPLLR